MLLVPNLLYKPLKIRWRKQRLTNMFFSILPNEYERQLKEEIWGCFKYIGIPMETIMSMPIQDRKFYIIKHNEAMQMEEKRFESAISTAAPYPSVLICLAKRERRRERGLSLVSS